MGKTPRRAAGGLFVAALMLAGCSTPSQTIATPAPTAQQPWKTTGQMWNNQPANGGPGVAAQNGPTGPYGGPPSQPGADARPPPRPTLGANGTFCSRRPPP